MLTCNDHVTLTGMEHPMKYIPQSSFTSAHLLTSPHGRPCNQLMYANTHHFKMRAAAYETQQSRALRSPHRIRPHNVGISLTTPSATCFNYCDAARKGSPARVSSTTTHDLRRSHSRNKQLVDAEVGVESSCSTLICLQPFNPPLESVGGASLHCSQPPVKNAQPRPQETEPHFQSHHHGFSQLRAFPTRDTPL